MTSLPRPAWLVGCGNMAGAMVQGWRAGGVNLTEVTVIRPSGTPVPGVRTLTEYPDETPRFVMLGFKPQKLDEIAPKLASHVDEDCVLVSMLAGVTAASLRERFPHARAIVRIMPNLPVAQIFGVTGIYSADLTETELAQLPFVSLGIVAFCQTEQELGVVGAVAAAGVAYVARFAQALAKSAEALGIRPIMARMIADQTLIGTGAYAATTSTTMDEIARRVASPQGTTEQGLAVLDAPDGLQPLVDRTLAAAIRRGEELAADARRD